MIADVFLGVLVIVTAGMAGALEISSLKNRKRGERSSRMILF